MKFALLMRRNHIYVVVSFWGISFIRNKTHQELKLVFLQLNILSRQVLRFVVKHIWISYARDFIYLIVSVFIFNGMTVVTRKKGIGIHEKQTVFILNNIVACLAFQFHNSWNSDHTLKQWRHSCHTIKKMISAELNKGGNISIYLSRGSQVN